MKIKDLYGRDRNINIKKYLIDYDKKSKSKFQFNVKQFFKPWWSSHCVCEEFRIPSSLLRCDYINFTKHFVIECQSDLHDNFSEHFHGNRVNFLASWHRDDEKEEWVKRIQFKFIEIDYADRNKLSRKWFVEKFGVDLI